MRRLPDGHGVSLEFSRVPAIGPLADLAERGLEGGSLSRTLTAAGHIPETGDAHIAVAGLDDADATALHRSPANPSSASPRCSATRPGTSSSR